MVQAKLLRKAVCLISWWVATFSSSSSAETQMSKYTCSKVPMSSMALSF